MSLNITERERQIVSGLAAGMTGKRIALAMCIDPKTVEWHLRTCRKRNNAKTSAQLVYMATLAGLVDIHSVHAKKPRNKLNSADGNNFKTSGRVSRFF